MALVKLADYYPNYKEEVFDGDDIKGFDVYADETNDKVGSVDDVLVDETTGRFRYLVIDTGIWIFGKKVLLPIGSSRIDYGTRRVYALGLQNKQQAEQLPSYDALQPLDYDQEEQVRGVYRPAAASRSGVTDSTNAYDRNTYSYDREPFLYDTNERDHQTLKLYEERLIANKNRQKTGEVAVGKRVVNETAQVSVPIEKERVVIERTSPAVGDRVVSPGEANFQEGEVARVEVYEETPDIHKEAYVREVVNVRKEVNRDTVNAEETLRREELDINSEGNPVIRQNP